MARRGDTPPHHYLYGIRRLSEVFRIADRPTDFHNPLVAILSGRQVWLRGALIAALTVAAYVPALRGGFIWDDDDHVTQNATLEDLSGLRQIWLERGAVPQYYPLVHTSFWIERQIWGLNPAGYHAVNIVLHAMAAILLWRVLVGLRVPGGFLAALVFALHPVGVESVAWITERKNVLSAVFYFASALAWIRTQPFGVIPDGPPSVAMPRSTRVAAAAADLPEGRRQTFWYALSLAFFVCAMLSKTIACSLPAAMLLVVWWKNGRVNWRNVRPLVPFFAIGIALAVNTALMERTRVGAIGDDWSFSLAERALIAGRATWFYATKLLWPSSLTFIYPRWEIDAGNWIQWLFPLGAVALVGALWVARSRIGRGPLVAVLFFGGTLVPALGFVNVYPMRFSFVADHFQYLASIGLIALGAAVLVRHRSVERAAYALPVLLGVLTWRQAHVYRDLETLWTDTIEKNPSAWLAHNNLGTVLLDRSDAAGAIVRYREAVRLKPDYYEARGNLGAALLRQGAIEEARVNTDEALRVSPDYVPALVNRAAILVLDGRPNDAIVVLQDVLRTDENNAEALNTLGSAFAVRGDYQNAERAFEAALRIEPQLVAARINLARVLLQTGRIETASGHLDRAIRESPNDADARNARGMILVAQGRLAEALAYFRELALGMPTDASARFNLGTVLSQMGQGAQAIEEFQAAIQLNPSHAEARNNLGIALAISGQYTEAIVQFEEAVRLNANNPGTHYNIAYALTRVGRLEEAESHLRETLRLRPDHEEARRLMRELRRPGGR